MVNKQEIADSLQISIGAMIDATRYIRLSGSETKRMIFRAPYTCKVKSCIMRAETLESTSGEATIALKKAASGTSLSTGTAIITSVNPKTGLTASTDKVCPILTASNANILAEGDSLGLVIGTTTELANLLCSVTIERLN